MCVCVCYFDDKVTANRQTEHISCYFKQQQNKSEVSIEKRVKDRPLLQLFLLGFAMLILCCGSFFVASRRTFLLYCDIF